jgi:hypothetical protein
MLFYEAEFLDVNLKSFPSWYSQSSLLTDFTPPSWSKSGLKLVCNVNIAYENLKSENSQDYAQKPQRICTFMNSASVVASTGQYDHPAMLQPQ